MSLARVIISIIGLFSGFISIMIFFAIDYKKKRIPNQNGNEFSGADFAYSGNLQQTTLIEAVQFLEIGHKDGILHIYCGRRKGYLTFLKGQVIDAFYRNYTGREAVIQMFDIDEGDFYFEPKSIFQPRIIHDRILDLAFEWDERKNSNEN